MQALKIDPEFRDKIPPMTEEQFSGLREDIIRDGYVRDPLVVWKEENILLDGHHRWRVICENWEALNDKYTVDYKSFPNRWAALEWICRNQLNKHNLNDEQITYIRGEMYKARKRTEAFKGNQYSSGGAQNEHKQKAGRTAEQIATELGIGKETVKRAEKFHDGIDAIREVSKEAADKVMGGGSGVTKKEVMSFPTMPPEEKKRIADGILSGEIAVRQSKPDSESKSKSKSDRESRAETEAIVRDMYDLSTVPEFTIDFLIEDIQANGKNYVNLLRNTLADRSSLLTEENKPRIAEAIETYVIAEIRKIKELVEK